MHAVFGLGRGFESVGLLAWGLLLLMGGSMDWIGLDWIGLWSSVRSPLRVPAGFSAHLGADAGWRAQVI